MTTQIQRRRGTTAQHSTFTGAVGEVTVDTDKEVLVVHDGAQVGGYPQMRENGSNSALALGSAGTPSLKFTGDPNTGIYSPGADQLAISTSGVGRLFVDASGNIGVGAATIRAQVHIAGVGQSTANLTDAGGRGGMLRLSGTGASGGEGGALLFTNNQGDAANSLGFAAIKGLLTDGSNNTAGDLAFSTRPTSASTSLQERLRITSAGLVGVGVSAPSHLLHLGGATGTSFGIALEPNGWNGLKHRFTVPTAGNQSVISNNYNGSAVDDATYATSSATFGNGFIQLATGGVNTAPSPRLYINASGSIGVGTTSADQALTVQGTISIRDPSGLGVASLGSIGGTFRIQGRSELNLPLTFWTGDAERGRFDTSGRLLVGTSTNLTSDNLQVAGSIGLSAQVGATNFYGYNNSNVNGPTARFFRSRSATIGTNAVVLNGDVVGVLDFRGADGTNFINAAAIACEVDGTPGTNDMPGRLVFSTTADGASSPTERMRITSDGSLYYGTGGSIIDPTSGTVDGFYINKPDNQFVMSRDGGAALVIRRRSSDGFAQAFYRSGNTNAVGTISVTTTATAYNTSSDYRLKENVTRVTDGITRLQQLKPSRFNFIADPDKTVDGFIAHEVQIVVPEAITGEKDAVDDEGNPEYQGIDQSKLVPLLTAALQEAIGRIESLEAEVAALKAS